MNIKTVHFANDVTQFVNSLDHTAQIEEYDTESSVYQCDYVNDDDESHGICFHDVGGDYVTTGKWALIY